MPDARKVVLDLSGRENLLSSLLGVYDSQISGGKRYDLATIGRYRSNATYLESHSVDTMNLAVRRAQILYAGELVAAQTDAEKQMPGTVKREPAAACDIGPRVVEALVCCKNSFLVDPAAVAYSPADDSYWDDTFTCDVQCAGSNTSYAHLAMCGQRKKVKWSNSQSASDPIIATRGTRDGATTGDEYKLSPTLKLHDTDREWFGNICFNDNHTETLNNFFPSQTAYEPMNGAAPEHDNIFAAEFTDFDAANGEASGDAFLVICTGSDDLGMTVEQVYDPLNQ